MLFQVFAFNLIVLLAFVFLGFYPCRLLERKTQTVGILTKAFLSLFLGYILFETGLAIIETKSHTVQWLNIIPIGFLYFLPDKISLKTRDNQKPIHFFIPISVLVFACWYFTKSYAFDLQTIDKYPFIDIVSYAATSFGLDRSGTEVSFADAAIYNPQPSQINLYHFTELWASAGFCKIFGVTSLWSMCFIVPVFLFSIIGFGLGSIATERKEPAIFSILLIVVFCFSNHKLLFFDDVFLLNVLDLHGLKLSLIIPCFLFLYHLRNHRQVLLLFLLWMPQINILLSVLLGLVIGVYFFTTFFTKEERISAQVWFAYILFSLVFLGLVWSGKGQSGGPAFREFSIQLALHTSFNYTREAFFNLGFNYWAVFIVVAAAVSNWKYVLLLPPFLFSKGVFKGLGMVLPVFQGFASEIEVVLLFLFLVLLNRKFKIFHARFYLGFAIIVILCLVAGIGYALTGFMDFEQIFTLVAASSIFIVCFFLFESVEGQTGFLFLIKTSWVKWGLASCVLVFVLWKTIRFQRALPFDQKFYNEITMELESEKGDLFSAYISNRRYSPFPLHIKAGFPLLFTFPTAFSTPVTMFEDSSWRGKDIAWHVEQFPFYSFYKAKKQDFPDGDLPNLKGQFLKEKKIRFLWIDEGYDPNKLSFLDKSVKKKFVTAADHLEFWIIDPEKL